VPDAFETLKNHIRSTHVHDNKKDRDSHLWPGDGTIPWPETLALLQSAPHVPPLLMEIDGDGKEQAKIVSSMSESFKKLEELAKAKA